MPDVIRVLPINFEKITDYQVDDIRFTKVKIYVMHTGLNENNSIFNKDVVEAAIPTLFNTPILGYIEDNSEGEKDFSNHREGIEVKDGVAKIKYKGHAYGTIPESCNPRWEDKLCEDGETRTFLCVDGLVWNKFDDSKEIYDRDLFKDQSMELAKEFEGSFNDEGHFVWEKFMFDGCCALSNGVQPAMTGACIEVQFSITDIESKLNLFNKYVHSIESDSTTDTKQNKD